MLNLPLLYEYATWANDRVLAAAEAITEADRHASMGHSFGTIHESLVHILSSEELWLARWRGMSPKEREVTAERYPTLDTLRVRWDEVSADMRTYVSALQEDAWSQVISYRTLDDRPASYPLWQMYLQVINHGTHHRAEVSSMLTERGVAPGELDMIVFFSQK